MKKLILMLLALTILCGIHVYADANIAITSCVQNIEKSSVDITLSVPEGAEGVTIILSRRPVTDFSVMGDAAGSIISFLQYDTVSSQMVVQAGYLPDEPENTGTVYVYANCGGAYIASSSVTLKSQNDFIVETFKNATAWNFYPDLISGYNTSFGMFALTTDQSTAFAGFSDVEKADVYKVMYLAKAGFSVVSDIETAYSSAIKAIVDAKNQNNNTNTGGGGGGGGGGGMLIPTPAEKPTPDEKPTSPTVPVVKPVFDDLDSEPWAKTAIEYLYKNGIVNGVDENSFAPSRVLKREEFITMLIRGTGIETQTGDIDFKDVPDDAYYAEYVKTAVSKGIVNGVGDDSFGAGQDLKRQDLAVMLYRAFFSGEEPKGAVEPLDIENVADYAQTAVKVLMEKGIVNGMGDGRFAPYDNSTRAQAAQLIYNLKQKGII